MTTATELKSRVEQLLDGLGDDGDAVAEHLKTLGVTGVPKDGHACPIYNYLRANDIALAAVDIESIDFDDGWMDTPPAVRDFIEDFDDGYFPELEASS